MLYIIFVSVTLSLLSAEVGCQELYPIPPETVVKIQKHSIPCIEKNNADPNVIRKLIDGSLADDESSKNFLLCFGIAAKYMDDEGHFIINKMSAILGNHPLVKPFETALAECNQISKEKPTETAYAMNLCYHEKVPVKFSL